MAKRHLTKDEIIFKAKAESMAFVATGRAVKMIAMIVLRERFGFTNEDLKEFLERFEDVLDYYNKSKDYQALLKEWDDFFYEEIGERILYDNNTYGYGTFRGGTDA